MNRIKGNSCSFPALISRYLNLGLSLLPQISPGGQSSDPTLNLAQHSEPRGGQGTVVEWNQPRVLGVGQDCLEPGSQPRNAVSTQIVCPFPCAFRVNLSDFESQRPHQPFGVVPLAWGHVLSDTGTLILIWTPQE